MRAVEPSTLSILPLCPVPTKTHLWLHAARVPALKVDTREQHSTAAAIPLLLLLLLLPMVLAQLQGLYELIRTPPATQIGGNGEQC